MYLYGIYLYQAEGVMRKYALISLKPLGNYEMLLNLHLKPALYISLIKFAFSEAVLPNLVIQTGIKSAGCEIE